MIFVDVAGRTITLTHDASGSVPTSATTDASGEATATYTAPSTPQIELVNATVDDDGVTSGDAIVVTTRVAPIVTVTPTFGFADPGQTVQFSASVANAPDQSVTWTASGGSINGNGLYTAGSTAGNFTVTARSVFDPGVTGSAFVQITEATALQLISSCFAQDRPPVEFVDRVGLSVLNAAAPSSTPSRSPAV